MSEDDGFEDNFNAMMGKEMVRRSTIGELRRGNTKAGGALSDNDKDDFDEEDLDEETKYNWHVSE